MTPDQEHNLIVSVAHLEEQVKAIPEMERSLNTIRAELMRQKGFWGAVVMIGTAVGIAIQMAWGWFSNQGS